METKVKMGEDKNKKSGRESEPRVKTQADQAILEHSHTSSCYNSFFLLLFLTIPPSLTQCQWYWEVLIMGMVKKSERKEEKEVVEEDGCGK